MNHPTQNEWLLYLDGEASAKDMDRQAEHLKQCPLCALEVAGWKRSIHKLQQMPFAATARLRPERGRDSLWASVFLKWGLAAAIVLAAGFVFGRLSVMRSHAFEQSVAAHVQEELRSELRADLLAALAPEHEAQDEFQRQLRLKAQSALANMNARLVGDLMQVAQQQRQQEQERMLGLIKEIRAQEIADCLSLRQDLETAVSTADSDLRQDSRRINQLANTILSVQKQ